MYNAGNWRYNLKVVYMSLVQISEHLVLINYIWVILSAGLGTNIITWVWKYGIPPSKPFERREYAKPSRFGVHHVQTKTQISSNIPSHEPKTTSKQRSTPSPSPVWPPPLANRLIVSITGRNYLTSRKTAYLDTQRAWLWFRVDITIVNGGYISYNGLWTSKKNKIRVRFISYVVHKGSDF